MDEGRSGPAEEDLLRQLSGGAPGEETLPDALPAGPAVSAETPEAPGPEPTVRPAPRRSWWERHRHELAGLVTAIVSLVWISLGLAARSWAPSLLGVTFAFGAFLIGSQAVWTGD